MNKIEELRKQAEQYEAEYIKGNDHFSWFMAAVIFAFMVSLLSCSPINKAERRVLADVESVKRVRALTDKLFPCSDTTPRIEFIKGDSIPYKVPYLDTAKMKSILAEINRSLSDTASKIKQAYILGYYAAIDSVKHNPPKPRLDKIIKHIPPDNRELNKLKDSIAALRLREAAFAGRIQQLSSAMIEYKQQRNEAYWILIGVGVVLLIVLIGWLLSKLKVIKL